MALGLNYTPDKTYDVIIIGGGPAGSLPGSPEEGQQSVITGP